MVQKKFSFFVVLKKLKIKKLKTENQKAKN